MLMPGTPQSRWCDDVTTKPVESCQDLLGKSLDLAVEELSRRYGADMSHWQWGEAHAAQLDHNVFHAFAVLRRLFDRTIPTGGGFYTINRGGYFFGSSQPFANIHGSAYRAIYDLSSFDASVFMQSTGQSGNPFSPFYDDLIDDWAEVDYAPMTVDRTSIDARAAGTLKLEPRRR
jgi:penicillin amidase